MEREFSAQGREAWEGILTENGATPEVLKMIEEYVIESVRDVNRDVLRQCDYLQMARRAIGHCDDEVAGKLSRVSYELSRFIHEVICDHYKNWERTWGHLYSATHAKIHFKYKLLPRYKEKAGDVILDIGSGRQYLARFLADKENEEQKIICVDIVARGPEIESNVLLVRLDIEKIMEPQDEEFQSAVSAVGDFLGRENGECPGIDSIIISEVLNYIDYKGVLSGLVKHLNPGGHMFIYNAIGRFLSGSARSEKRPRSMNEVVELLQELGMEMVESHPSYADSDERAFVMRKPLMEEL